MEKGSGQGYGLNWKYVLALLDALEEMEEARDINVATNIELIKQHAEIEENFKAQLATVEKERQREHDKFVRVNNELATAQETIMRQQKIMDGNVADQVELEREMEKFGLQFTDEHGGLYPVQVISEYISTLRTTHQASVEALKRVKDAGEYLWIVLASASGGDWTKQTPEWQEAAGKARDDYFSAINPQHALGEGKDHEI